MRSMLVNPGCQQYCMRVIVIAPSACDNPNVLELADCCKELQLPFTIEVRNCQLYQLYSLGWALKGS